MSIIDPRVLKGFRDFDQLEMAKRKHVEKLIRKVFAKFGYAEIETPILEYSEILLGKYGDEGDKLTYNFVDNGDRSVAMRYDQTVPFARYVAGNLGTLVRPFKRFQIGNVFRADKPQKGRYRQFTQCDIDIIGSNSVLSDLEIIQVVVEIIKELGLKNVKVKFSDRNFLNSVLEKAGVSEKDKSQVITNIDKVDKIGPEKVLELIEGKGDLKIIGTLLSRAGDTETRLVEMSEYYTDRIEQIWEMVCELDLQKFVEFDPSMARGLDYYTGMVMETFVENSEIGSICSGGRYDNLLGMFSKEVLSGIGFGLGFDRVVDVMEEQELLNDVEVVAEYLVTVFDEESRLSALKVANALRAQGGSVEIYMGDNLKLGKQFKYAERRGIKKVVVLGEDEVEKFEKERILVVKDMASGQQSDMKI
jgi:histidyl-tRNA synthetase